MFSKWKSYRAILYVIPLLATFALFQNFSYSVAERLPLYDFMVMDVCVDNQGKVLKNVAPGEVACLHRRNIEPGEKIPYHMHAFTGSSACKLSQGKVSKDNIPVTGVNGVTRIVSLYDKGVNHACSGVAATEPSFGVYEDARKDLTDKQKNDSDHSEGDSIQWLNSQYGFIMGSWSPVALSSWVTPFCKNYPRTSQRSFEGWVIGPVQIPTTNGKYGYANFKSLAVNSDTSLGLERELSRCPNDFGSASFTTWVKDNFTLTSKYKTSTLISDHYSQGSDSGMNPGESLQIERTYWTREFGLTRWEKWARDDWKHPTRGGSLDGKSAQEIAEMMYSSHSCSTPYGPSDNVGYVTPELASSKVMDSGKSFSFALRETVQNGARHVWYLTQCSDYSQIVKDPAGGLDPTPWLNHLDFGYWKE